MVVRSASAGVKHPGSNLGLFLSRGTWDKLSATSQAQSLILRLRDENVPLW